jgi:hypothetical protein
MIIKKAMEYYDVLKLKADWGNKPCNHPHFEKMYYAGAFLITYCCTQCGREFTIARKLEIEESVARENQNN